MLPFDLTLGDAIQGACGTIALYLAFQLKGMLANHEIRITTLEVGNASPRNPKRPRRTKR